jgi:hypothetical protein
VVEGVLCGGLYTVASGGRYPVPTDIIMTARCSERPHTDGFAEVLTRRGSPFSENADDHCDSADPRRRKPTTVRGLSGP